MCIGLIQREREGGSVGGVGVSIRGQYCGVSMRC